MALKDRQTRAGPLYPVNIADIADGINLDVILGGTFPGISIPVVPGAGASFPTTITDDASIDAFARRRFSTPFTIFDSKQVWDDPDLANNVENFPFFWDNQEVSGSGTATSFDVDRASTTLSVSANTAGRRVRQTRQRFNYQPGKSLLIILTGVTGTTSSGNSKSYGYFDDDNGVFYRDDDGVWSVVIRSSVSGSAVDNAIPQSSWNLDKLDGTGPSGISLDQTKVQITFIDLEWLGAGRVRFGFFIDGLPVYCHQFVHANTISSAYMSTANLPLRMEIENDGTGGADSVEQICGTVISEGGLQPAGAFRFADIGTTSISGATQNTIYAICGIRLKTNYLSADVRESFVSIIENTGTNNPYIWRLHFNPTIAQALTYTGVSQSAVEFGIGDTATAANNVISDIGHVIAGGYQARQNTEASVHLESALRLGSLIDGTQDEFVLSATPLTNNNEFFGGIQWQELW